MTGLFELVSLARPIEAVEVFEPVRNLTVLVDIAELRDTGQGGVVPLEGEKMLVGVVEQRKEVPVVESSAHELLFPMELH
jgi:hypothetical protein